MGLFRGFRAKFTGGTSTSKNKTQEVVCLKYHIHSEFDGQDAVKPVPIGSVNGNEPTHPKLKRKERKAVTKSAIFPESHSLQSSLPSSTPQKSLSLTNLSSETETTRHGQENGYAGSTDPITVSTTFTLPSNGTSVAVSDTQYKKTIEEHNGLITEKVAVVTNNHLYSTDHFARNEQHTQSILKKVSSYDEGGTLTNGAKYMSNAEMSFLMPPSTQETTKKENGLGDQSTLIFMTQHSSRSSSFDRSMETDDINFTRSIPSLDSNKLQDNFNEAMAADGNFNINFVPNHAPEEDVDYFKINVVKYDLNRTYSQSEEERSHEDEPEPRFARMGYSSQAASIFFGEGEETEVVRPRRIQLTEEEDDEERRSSGADC